MTLMIIQQDDKKIRVATDRNISAAYMTIGKVNKINIMEDGFHVLLGMDIYPIPTSIEEIYNSRIIDSNYYCFDRKKKHLFRINKEEGTEMRVQRMPLLCIAGLDLDIAFGMFHMMGHVYHHKTFLEKMKVIFPLINEHSPLISAEFDYHEEDL